MHPFYHTLTHTHTGTNTRACTHMHTNSTRNKKKINQDEQSPSERAVARQLSRTHLCTHGEEALIYSG